MNKEERRKVRERKVGEARAAVADYARARRIAATQEEFYRLAEAKDVEGFKALLDTDAGRELGAYNAQKLEPLPVTPRPPAAARNSVRQESILAALADGELALTRDILTRIGETQPTAATRVTVSRALYRLVRKGLVEAFVLDDGRMLQGKGYLWRLAR
jgi:DNA-binding transcriptional ArsR family regulator